MLREHLDAPATDASATEISATLSAVQQSESSAEQPVAVSTVAEGPTADREDLEVFEDAEAFEDDEKLCHRTFRERSVYLPSRGWSAAWLGLADRLLRIKAFIDLEYTDAGPDGSRGGVSTFDNHHTQIFLESRIRPGLEAHAELEWEHSGDTVEVDQAYVSWAVKDSLSLDFGRFYTPFGIERFVWYSPTNALVSRPMAFRAIVPNNFYANGIKAAGVVGGDRFLFSYEASITDGLGEDALENRRGSRQVRDNNSSRALSGRLGFAGWPWWEVGASYHGQRYSTNGDESLRFFGLDFAGRRKGFELRAEWVSASLDLPGPAGGDLEQQGWYSQLSYTKDWSRTFFPSLTLVSRYDDLVLDRDLTDSGSTGWSFGVNSEVYENFRLKAEIQLLDEEGPKKDNDQFLLQAVVDF